MSERNGLHEMYSKFFQDQSGSIGPIFIVCLPFVLAIVGGAVDYSRVVSHKGKLQSLTEMAAQASVNSSQPGKSRKQIAISFLEANLPDADLSTKLLLVNNQLVLKTSSKLSTPVLSMVGRSEFEVTAKANIPAQPNRITKKNSLEAQEKRLRDYREFIRQRVAKVAPKYRARVRKQYERRYQNLKRWVRKNG